MTLPRISTPIAVLLSAALALTFCSHKTEQAKEKTTEAQVEAQSNFIQPTDSLRWQGYLSFSPQDTALSFIMLGALYLVNKYPEEALHYLDIALTYDIDRPVIYLNMGYAYNLMGDHEKASDNFRQFVQREPGSILSQEIFRIVEKYRSLSAESDIP